MKTIHKFFALSLLLAVLLAACGQVSTSGGAAASTVSYEMTTNMVDGKMVFIGVGGNIDGQINPMLKAETGQKLKVTLSSGDGAEHNIYFPDFNAESEHVGGNGAKVTLTFDVTKGGEFAYYCNLPGHRQAGMEGKLAVAGESMAMPDAPAAPTDAPIVANLAPTTAQADIVRAPNDIPRPVGDREPTTVRLDLEAVEVEGQLADGTTYTYWTFNGQVPGPFFRVRVGDTIEVHMKNSISSTMIHSVDFHAVTGPGGGAVMSQTKPGEETMFTAKALTPGLYVYHCATPMVASHISNGMYGMILVEPEGGLPPVDREFYVMQGELYTSGAFGATGHQTEDTTKLLNEDPEYFVFNGAVGALTDRKPLNARVGETIRIFFGVGGPNFTSSFHVIGEILDRVFDQASLTSAPLTNVQTTMVPPGGATMIELKLDVPGRYILVDHALARMQRGLAGYLVVEGPDQPEIFNGTPTDGSGH